MAEVLKVIINGTDFGSAGEGILVGISVTAAGPGVRGTARVTLRKGGGGYASVLKDKAEVKAFSCDSVTGVISRRLFGGFVAGRRTSGVIGTNLKVWFVDCVDYNLLLDSLVGGASVEGTPETIVVASASFATQVADLVDQLQNYGGVPTSGIDAVSQVVDLTAGDPLAAVSFLGQSLRAMLQDRYNAAQVQKPALRPRGFIGVNNGDSVSGPTDFGPAMLYVYDGAASPTISHTLSDVGPWTGSTHPIYDYEDDLDGTKLANYRQGTYAGGGAVTADVASTSEVNNYIGHEGWADVPVAHFSSYGERVPQP